MRHRILNNLIPFTQYTLHELGLSKVQFESGSSEVMRGVLKAKECKGCFHAGAASGLNALEQVLYGGLRALSSAAQAPRGGKRLLGY